MDASRGTPISFTLPELFNALGGFRAWSIERRREPFFPPKLRSYIPRHAWWWASCMLRSFLHKKINQQNEKRVQLGTVVSWVLRPSETNTISKCPSATKSLQTWGLVCHYNIFHQPLGIIESILIRGNPFFCHFLFGFGKNDVFFFSILGSPEIEQEGRSWRELKKASCQKTPVLARVSSIILNCCGWTWKK